MKGAFSFLQRAGEDKASRCRSGSFVQSTLELFEVKFLEKPEANGFRHSARGKDLTLELKEKLCDWVCQCSPHHLKEPVPFVGAGDLL